MSEQVAPLPCPFCNSPVSHAVVIVPRPEKTLNFHEWYHVHDNLDCPVRRHGRIIASCPDNPEARAVALVNWNARRGIIKDFE